MCQARTPCAARTTMSDRLPSEAVARHRVRQVTVRPPHRQNLVGAAQVLADALACERIRVPPVTQRIGHGLFAVCGVQRPMHRRFVLVGRVQSAGQRVQPRHPLVDRRADRQPTDRGAVEFSLP